PDLPSHTDHRQNGHAIDDLIQLLATNPPEKLRSAQIETERVAVVGHSAGGLATLLAASKNRRVVLWVGLDPVDSGDIRIKPADDQLNNDKNDKNLKGSRRRRLSTSPPVARALQRDTH